MIAVLLVIAIAASVAMPLLSGTMDTYLGRGALRTVRIEGAGSRNTKYYDQKYTDTSGTTGSVSYGLFRNRGKLRRHGGHSLHRQGRRRAGRWLRINAEPPHI